MPDKRSPLQCHQKLVLLCTFGNMQNLATHRFLQPHIFDIWRF
ncbi:Uncharacterised protein [Vibrio cholerae]|nr:Uncharacterised protein [Vibrio cholerae]